MVGNVCEKCGLPKELCVCEVVERETQNIKAYVTMRKFRKPVTIVEGVNKDSAKTVVKELKRKLACGGSYKEGNIELQGNHLRNIKGLLVKLGFDEEQIEVE
ncbi:MAG: stress response translation initiation inhibitor YciH [Candidatus Aenigmarchaeota archaeon CG01_land_8_20_14_3_00_37_9]|nr:MAG: stress response translation initiation inhibitor YciH [Candidatus Aenigmarchaeota archaeon CG01_land_8_20_14_3_00_37_9]